MGQLFSHRLTYKKKKANDDEYGRSFIDSVDVYSGSQSFSNYSIIKENMLINYDLFNNRIDLNDFMQYNPETEEDVIGKFQHYDIAVSKLRVLIGEMRQRPLKFHAYAVNPEAYNERLEFKKQLLTEYVDYRIKNAFGNNPQPKKDNISLELIERQASRNFITAGEIDANNILKYHVKHQDINTKLVEGFKDILITAVTCHYVGERDGKPILELLNPLYLNYHKSPENKRIEEAAWASYEYRLTLSDIYDRWGDDDEAMEKLTKTFGYAGYISDSQYRASGFYHPNDEYYQHLHRTRTINRDTYDSQILYQTELYRVLHVEWKSLRKIGFLTRRESKYGEPIPLIVDEEYKMNKDIGDEEITWRWINEVWEGYKIGAGPDCVYFGVNPKKIQFNNINNINSCKLGYHGEVLNARNSEPVSLLDRGKPYQYMFIVIHVQLERLLSSDIGKVLIADVNTIPDNLTPDQWMHIIRQFKLALIDSASPKSKKANFNQMGSHDLSASANAIAQRIQLLDYFSRRCSEVMGVTRQREGQVSPHSNVSDNQQSIVQSSHSTEDDFATYDSYIERLLTSFIEVCRIVYKNNPFNATMLDANSTVFVNTENLNTYDYNVFIANRSKERDIVNMIEQLAQPMMQNGYKISDVVSLVMDDASLSKKIENIRQIEQRLQQQQEEAAKQQQEHEQQLAQLNEQSEAANRQNLKDIADSKNITSLEIKKMDVELQLAMKEFDKQTQELSNYTKQTSDTERANIDRTKIERDSTINREKLNIDRYKETNKKSIEKIKQANENRRAKIQADTAKTVARSRNTNSTKS